MDFLRLSHLRLGSRLGLGFGLLLLLMGAMLALALTRFAGVGAANDKILGSDWAKADAAATVKTLVRANGGLTMELFFVEDAAQQAQIRAGIAANKQQISEALALLDKLIYTEQGRRLLGEVQLTRAAFVASFGQVDRLLVEGRREAASQTLLAETLPALERLQSRVGALSDLQKQLADAAGQDIHQQIVSTRRLLLAAGLVALLLGLGLAWLLTRSITRPIGRAVALAESVASGDLRAQVDVAGRDETSRLLAALKTMTESLARTVNEVRHSSDSIATASSQIASGNADLSQRTEAQASNLQQTAASMEEITGSVKSNADSARQASRLAGSASAAAAQGGDAVKRVVQTMDEINASSQRITDIIGVIDDLAFQTNILALNASVEAARAGEQGRGFAVVATEVRSLARRSAQAAQEIKTLINESVTRADAGSRLAGDAGQAMNDIVAQVRRVAHLIDGISHASQEQSSGISQVGSAVNQLDQVTQQNAALVEESAAAAESLSQQASQLVRAVGMFKTAA